MTGERLCVGSQILARHEPCLDQSSSVWSGATASLPQHSVGSLRGPSSHRSLTLPLATSLQRPTGSGFGRNIVLALAIDGFISGHHSSPQSVVVSAMSLSISLCRLSRSYLWRLNATTPIIEAPKRDNGTPAAEQPTSAPRRGSGSMPDGSATDADA